MIELSGLNYVAVVITWLVNMVVGAFWYSPAGFQKTWSKLGGVDMMKTPKEETNRAIVWVAAASLVQSVVLAIALNTMHVTTVTDGIVAGVLLWLGLTAATTIGNTLYSRLSLKFWWLNASFFLVVTVINSVILVTWR